MSRQRRISYMVDKETGYVYSRVASEVAIPVIDFAGMSSKDNFAIKANLEKFNVLDVCRSLLSTVGTRKIPIEIKNEHRKFWGMSLLK